MTLPTRHDFFVADDARSEKDEKTTLVGYYGGAEVIVTGGAQPPFLLPGLSLVVVVSGGAGTYQMRAELRDPNSNDLGPPISGEVQKEPAKSLTLSFRIAPFRVPAFGNYRMTVQLRENEQTRDYACPFYIGSTP